MIENYKEILSRDYDFVKLGIIHLVRNFVFLPNISLYFTMFLHYVCVIVDWQYSKAKETPQWPKFWEEKPDDVADHETKKVMKNKYVVSLKVIFLVSFSFFKSIFLMKYKYDYVH